MHSMDYKDYKSTEKTLVKKEVFWEQQYGNKPTWKNIKHLDLQDDDEIIIAYEEYNEDGGGGYWYISVERWVEETEEQFKKRLKRIEEEKERIKKLRYENYLKLKAEFENDKRI